MTRGLLFGIDYDKTWTADPEFWRNVVELALQHQHAFVCVTARNVDREDVEAGIDGLMPIVYAGDQWKKKAAEECGFAVDIWIDDRPNTIAPPKPDQPQGRTA